MANLAFRTPPLGKETGLRLPSDCHHPTLPSASVALASTAPTTADKAGHLRGRDGRLGTAGLPAQPGEGANATTKPSPRAPQPWHRCRPPPPRLGTLCSSSYDQEQLRHQRDTPGTGSVPGTSLRDIHDDMEALSAGSMAQAKVFCRQQSFQFKIKRRKQKRAK